MCRGSSVECLVYMVEGNGGAFSVAFRRSPVKTATPLLSVKCIGLSVW